MQGAGTRPCTSPAREDLFSDGMKTRGRIVVHGRRPTYPCGYFTAKMARPPLNETVRRVKLLQNALIQKYFS